MLAVKRSAGVTHKVNFRNLLHAGNKAHKQGIHPGFENQSRQYQKSIIGVSVVTQKEQMSSNLFFEKEVWEILRHGTTLNFFHVNTEVLVPSTTRNQHWNMTTFLVLNIEA